MITGDVLRQVAEQVDRSMKRADPDRKDEVSAVMVEQIGFAAGWVSSLRDFSLMPGTARGELEAANQALERAANIVERNTGRSRSAH
jgi:hypothetical protein